MSKARTGRHTVPPPAIPEIDRTAARYLLAISVLSTAEETRITTGALRKHLNVAPASVTEMIAKLDDRELADYEKYRGVRLTDRGATIADRVARRFCIVTSFFETVLDADLDKQTAFEIGMVLPDGGIARLRELVTSPCLDLCPESERDVDCCAG